MRNVVKGFVTISLSWSVQRIRSRLLIASIQSSTTLGTEMICVFSMCVFFLLSLGWGRHVSPLVRLRVALCIRLGEAQVALPTRHPDFADCRQEWEAHCCRHGGYVCAFVAMVSPSSQQIADSSRDCLQCHYRASCTAADAKVTIDRAAGRLFFCRHFAHWTRSKNCARYVRTYSKKKKKETANVVINLDISLRSFHPDLFLFIGEKRRILCTSYYCDTCQCCSQICFFWHKEHPTKIQLVFPRVTFINWRCDHKQTRLLVPRIDIFRWQIAA